MVYPTGGTVEESVVLDNDGMEAIFIKMVSGSRFH